jgi:hypothetical protein
MSSKETTGLDGSWNKSEISIAGGGRAMAAPSTEDAGRSYTFSLVIADEAAFHRYAARNYLGYRPTTEGGGQIILISTGNGMTGKGRFFHSLWWASRKGQTDYRAKFFSWRLRPDRGAGRCGNARCTSTTCKECRTAQDKWYAKELRNYLLDPENTDKDEAGFAAEFPDTPQQAFLALADLMFPKYDDSRQTSEPPFRWCDAKWRYAGIDWGGTAPTAIVVVGVSGSGRIHVFGEFYRRYADLDQVSDFLWSWVNQGGGFDAIMCDWNESFSINSLRKAGFRTALHAEKDRGSGYRLMQGVVQNPALFTISRSCPNTRSELMSLRKDPDSPTEWKTLKPDHAADSLRYVLLKAIHYRDQYTTKDAFAYDSVMV